MPSLLSDHPQIDNLLGDPQRPADPLLSLVVPVYNEAATIRPFLAAVQPTLEHLALRYEILFINDGSHDDTLQQLLTAICDDPRLRCLNLSRNFGKEAALTAGIEHASGDLVVPMDVDLQDPPELIAEFIVKWREGYDVVYGIRQDRSSDTTTKRATAGWFYRIFNHLSPVSIPENAGDYRLIDRRVVEALRQFPERNRFMKGLFAWVGFHTIGIPYTRQQRQLGQSKFSYWKLWNFAIDGITSFSSAPLRIWTYIGTLIAGLAFLYALFIVTRVLLTGVDMPGYASLMTVILFLGGVQLMSLGILGEFIGRLFTEVKARPLYLVEGIYQRRQP